MSESTMSTESFQPPRGTRDLALGELSVRSRISEMLSRIVESYGFRPLDTPAFENFDFLSKKSGPEVKQQIYYFKDKADRELGLRFDWTVPIVRYVLNNPNLAKPIRLYSAGKVWRYEEISAGRFREFSQIDVEIFGSDSLLVDAETIAVGIACLKVFGLEKIKVKINVREILEGFAKSLGVPDERKDDFFRAVDKKEKLAGKEFEKEFEKLGLGEKEIRQVKEYCKLSGPIGEVIRGAEQQLNQNELVAGGLAKLKELFGLLRSYGIEEFCEADLAIARGLDYYTGIIFEMKAGSYGLSVIGGGRYDKLIGLYSGKDMPATGFGMGLDRLYEILEKEGKLPAALTGSAVIVIPIGTEALPASIEILQNTRAAGVNAEIDVMGRTIGKNLEFADKAKMRFAVIIGAKELAEGKATVKDLESGESELLEFGKVPFYVSGKLAAK